METEKEKLKRLMKAMTDPNSIGKSMQDKMDDEFIDAIYGDEGPEPGGENK